MGVTACDTGVLDGGGRKRKLQLTRVGVVARSRAYR
jgi:hypothetical protein